VIVFNPLAGGLLTGKHRPDAPPDPRGRFGDALGTTATTYRKRYWQQESLEAVAALKAFFDGRGTPLARAAVRWVLDQPGISAAIVGASRPEQLDQTLAACDHALDPEEASALDEVWYRLPRRRPAEGVVR
jgi:aryl-alcohol dehydrogenase-like predicted oxidoreductase